MKNLIFFEQIKFWRSKKTIIVLIAFVTALIGMIMFNTAKDKAYWGLQELSLIHEQVRIKNEISLLEAQLEAGSTPEDTQVDEELNGVYKLYRAQYLLNYRQQLMAENFHKGKASARERIELWIERDQNLLKGLEAGYSFLDEVPVLVEQRLSMNQYIAQENIKAISSPYEMTSTNFVYRLADYPWVLIILAAFSLLSIDMFSGDVEGGAYKTIYSQPHTRGKIHAVKFLVHFTNSLFAITGLIILVFAVLSLVNGIGDIGYPTSYYSASYQSFITASDQATSSFSFVPWSTYIINTLPLYCLLCFFITSTVGTISLIANNTTNGLNILFCLLFLDFISRTLFSMENNFFKLWPFSPSELNSVLGGLYSLSTSAYLVLLGLWTVFLLTSGLFVLKKRDLAGGASE